VKAGIEQVKVQLSKHVSNDGGSLFHTLNNNNNNITMIFIVMVYCAKPYARVHLGPLSGSRSAPGGYRLLGKLQTRPLIPSVRLLWAKHSLITIVLVLLQP